MFSSIILHLVWFENWENCHCELARNIGRPVAMVVPFRDKAFNTLAPIPCTCTHSHSHIDTTLPATQHTHTHEHTDILTQLCYQDNMKYSWIWMAVANLTSLHNWCGWMEKRFGRSFFKSKSVWPRKATWSHESKDLEACLGSYLWLLWTNVKLQSQTSSQLASVSAWSLPLQVGEDQYLLLRHPTIFTKPVYCLTIHPCE